MYAGEHMRDASRYLMLYTRDATLDVRDLVIVFRGRVSNTQTKLAGALATNITLTKPSNLLKEHHIEYMCRLFIFTMRTHHFGALSALPNIGLAIFF